MKVSVDGKEYDSEEIPIILLLDSDTKELISNMAQEATKFCVYPDDVSTQEITDRMHKAFSGE